jgi:hypothetical protein
MANIYSIVSCVVKALVEATPISGPAFVYRTRSDSRASELSLTLQIVRMGVFFDFASRSAARVSAVSPDCEMRRVRHEESSNGFR